MTYTEIVKQVAEELHLPEELVDKAYKGFWIFIRDSIQKLPLKEIEDKDFSSLKTNFNIPSLGKLYCSYEKWLGARKKHEIIKELKQNGIKNN